MALPFADTQQFEYLLFINRVDGIENRKIYENYMQFGQIAAIGYLTPPF